MSLVRTLQKNSLLMQSKIKMLVGAESLKMFLEDHKCCSLLHGSIDICQDLANGANDNDDEADDDDDGGADDGDDNELDGETVRACLTREKGVGNAKYK